MCVCVSACMCVRVVCGCEGGCGWVYVCVCMSQGSMHHDWPCFSALYYSESIPALSSDPGMFRTSLKRLSFNAVSAADSISCLHHL